MATVGFPHFYVRVDYIIKKQTQKKTGWWFQPTPLKNDGVRQLG